MFKSFFKSADNIGMDHIEANLYKKIENYNIDWSEYFKVNGIREKGNPIVHYILNWRLCRPVVPGVMDTNYYLSVYEDILETDTEPLTHYLDYGSMECRENGLGVQGLNISEDGEIDFSPDKETIAIVSHSSEASGAPLLGLSLAMELSKTYNIVHIVLNPSDIHREFLKSCYRAITNRRSIYDVFFIFQELVKQVKIKSIIFNSIATSDFLTFARILHIPSVFLIHEFSEYSFPKGKMFNAILGADQVVFPAEIVYESAKLELRQLDKPRNIHIIPQGKLELEFDDFEYGNDLTIEGLYKKLNIKDRQDVKIVVGAGWIEPRKGVDLFIQTASQIRKQYKGKCKFIWVGGDQSQQKLWLSMDVKGHSMDNDFIFLDHQKNLNNIFEVSDVFLLTSRLDPFPNVVLDAMSHNLHIGCFNGSSGFPDVLLKYNADCTIANYLDVVELGRGVSQYLSTSKDRQLNENIVRDYFSFDEYASRLIEVIHKAEKFRMLSDNIQREISSSGIFDSNFFSNSRLLYKDSCRRYVDESLKGVLTRNPTPGFNNKLWLQKHKTDNAPIVPLYEALKGEDPIKTHECQIVPCQIDKDGSDSISYAVHLHLFYIDLVDEFVGVFNNLRGNFDILITVTNPDYSQIALEKFQTCGAKNVHVFHVANLGRNGWAFYFELSKFITEGGYEVIGHVHTKKTFDADFGVGDRWRGFLLQNLMGDGDTVQCILDMFSDKDLGLVFPEDSEPANIGDNGPYVEDLLNDVGVGETISDTSFFPVGNMFWARVDAIKDLFYLDPDKYSMAEPLPYDGTPFHALERVIPLVVEHNGYKCKTVHKEGVFWW